MALPVSLLGCSVASRNADAGIPSPLSPDCLVRPEGPLLRDTIVVALPGPLRPSGEVAPPSPVERFVADHLGRSFIPVDCTGRPDSTAHPSYRWGTSSPAILYPADPDRTGPAIRVEASGPDTDPRDLIDRGVDVVIAADPVTLDYARARTGLRSVPLAWDTRYLLVAPPGSSLPLTPSSALRVELARDAVSVEARPAEFESPAEGHQRCAAYQAGGSLRLDGIAIPSGDEVARALAERIVALAGPAGPRRVIAYSATAFDSVLAAGSVTAYLVPQPRYLPPDCLGVPPIPPGAARAPLIETRTTAVLRPGVPAFLIRGTGGIRFVPGRKP